MTHEPDIRCTPAEGRAYREGVYRPVHTDSLEDAPVGPDFPDPGHGPPFHRLDDVPKVPRVRDIVGPSALQLISYLFH